MCQNDPWKSEPSRLGSEGGTLARAGCSEELSEVPWVHLSGNPNMVIHNIGEQLSKRVQDPAFQSFLKWMESDLSLGYSFLPSVGAE